jgi:hypothetical protein
MDEDSILYQAMKEQMTPQVDQAAMKIIPGTNPYQLGLEMRQGGPGGVVTNPTRMARPPSDFAGRNQQANDNPAFKPPGGSAYGYNYTRPTENVITHNKGKWESDRFSNMIEQAAKAREEQSRMSTSQQILQNIRDFFNKNRRPDLD